MATLTYWKAVNEDDPMGHLRAKTRKELLKMMEYYGKEYNEKYEAPYKISIAYKDALNLLDVVSEEYYDF